MKKILSLILVLAMTFSLSTTALAADSTTSSYMVNNSSSRKRYASPKAGTELYLDLVFRQ